MPPPAIVPSERDRMGASSRGSNDSSVLSDFERRLDLTSSHDDLNQTHEGDTNEVVVNPVSGLPIKSTKKKRGQLDEAAVEEMASKAKIAMQIGEIRDPMETERVMAEIEHLARTPRTQKKHSGLSRLHGIKDLFLEHFVARLDRVSKRWRASKRLPDEGNSNTLAQMLASEYSQFPINKMNPAVQIDGEIPIDICRSFVYSLSTRHECSHRHPRGNLAYDTPWSRQILLARCHIKA
jgi:hypothetical protein